MTSGVSAVPKAGIYQFFFVGKGVGIDKGIHSAGFAAVHLTVNGSRVAVASSRVSDATKGSLTISLHATISLEEGYTISIENYTSSVLHDDHTFNTPFSGSLLEENVIL